MSFPTELTNAIDGVTEIVAAHLNNLEVKVGIDNSAAPASLDYSLKNASSIDPGHKHTAGALNGGNNGEVLYKAAGAWGPGTPDAAGLVAKSGDQTISGVKTFTGIPLGPASNPSTDNQLARKAYVDLMLPLTGGVMAGNISLNNYRVTGLAAAAGTGEALRYDEWIAAQDPGHKHSKLWASDGNPEAVTVDASGNVGIGTTSPSVNLEVRKATGNSVIQTTSVATANYASTAAYSDIAQQYLLVFGSTYAGTVAGLNRASMVCYEASYVSSLLFSTVNSGTAPIVFAPGRSEKVRIDFAGNVGIGTTSPGKKLDVNGYLRGNGIFNNLNSAPADGDLAVGECALWFDKTDGAAKLMIKAKQNDGTVKTASISLS